MTLKTKIFYRNGYRNIKPDTPPTDSRMLRSFLLSNNGHDCFMKGQGGWYKITKNNEAIFVARKNLKTAKSTIGVQIGILEGDIGSQEDKVEKAEEVLQKAIHPTERIQSREDYTENITRADFALKTERAKLKELKDDMQFWQNILETYIK